MSTADAGEIEAWLRLTACAGATPAAVRTLLGGLGPPEQIFAAPARELARLVGPDLARALRAPVSPAFVERFEAIVAWAQASDQHFVALGDPDYPSSLLETPDPPLVLYIWGEPRRLVAPLLGILLSRQATGEGLRNASEFARALALRKIELMWEETTLRSFPTLALAAGARALAVAGSGSPLPASGAGANRARATLVSEHAPGAGPERVRPRRANRLFAGLCRAILVVQGARHSEIFETARAAGQWGRDIFAVPGSIHSPLSKAGHQLIKDGAKLVESSVDIFSELAGFARGE